MMGDAVKEVWCKQMGLNVRFFEGGRRSGPGGWLPTLVKVEKPTADDVSSRGGSAVQDGAERALCFRVGVAEGGGCSGGGG
jgi:hypothetical protein